MRGRGRETLTRSRRLRASRVRLRPLLPSRCSRQHLIPPPASAPVPVPASSEPKETAAVAPVAREPGAPSPALAPLLLTAASVPPPASAPLPVPASSEPRRLRRLRRLHASRVRLRPLLPRRCSRQHLSRRPPRLPRSRRRFTGSSSPHMGGGKRIHPRRPRSLTLQGMRRRHRPFVRLCRRVAGPLWSVLRRGLRGSGSLSTQCGRGPRVLSGAPGANSRTSLAGASRSCAALILVRRASTTAPWSVPLRQWKRRLECAPH